MNGNLQFKGIRKDTNEPIIGGVSHFNGVINMFDSKSIDNSCYEVHSESVVRFVKKDKNGKSIFEKEKFKFKYLKELHNPIELVGSFYWNDDDLRYEIDIWYCEEYTCLSYVGNGTMYGFELIH